MFKGEFEIVFKEHAIFRADGRRIPREVVEATIQTGEFTRFGRRRVKISRQFDVYKVTCVGEIIGQCIRIITITGGKT